MADIEFINETRGTSTAEPIDAEVVLIDRDLPAPHGDLCEACGSPVEPLDKFCPACGTPNAHSAAPIEAEVVEPKKHLRCETCGAEIAMDLQQRSFACPFCDSTYVVEYSPDLTGRQPPEFVIGFSVTAEQARKMFREWIGQNAWYRPGDLKHAEIADKLRGVYLPFWSFSMLAESDWSASIGEYWYRTETYTETDSKGNRVTKTRRVRETEWWPLSGRHHRYYSGYLVSGSRGLPQTEADRIKPFQLPALKRYEPFYLAGWLSEEYSIDRNAALQICQQEFYRREQSNVGAFMPGDTHQDLAVQTQFTRVNSDLCLLPVYILTYRYRDKLFRFLVNGQTGRVAGDKPVSQRRIAALIGTILGVIALVILTFLILSGLLAR